MAWLTVVGCLGAAPAEARGLWVVGRESVEFGGDEMASLTFEDGQTKSLTAGGAYSGTLGVLYVPGKWDLAVEALVGLKLGDVTAANGSMELTRMPVDVVVSYVFGGLRLGLGPTFHIAPTYQCKIGNYCDGSIAFDHALGGIAEASFSLKSTRGYFDFGARYTLIRYGAGDGTWLNGSSFGIFCSVGWSVFSQ